MKRKLVAILIRWLAVASICAVALVSCTQGAVDQRDEIFGTTVAVGVRLNEGLMLLAGDSEYRTQYDSVFFHVVNRTGHDLAFEDDAFGVRGFVFNEEEAKWEQITLGFGPGEPGPRYLRNGATEHSETLSSFPTDWMDTKGHTAVRLLVIGLTATGEKYGAYADIRIVEGGPAAPTPTTIMITPLPSP